jgi:uncharacterized protein DUF4129
MRPSHNPKLNQVVCYRSRMELSLTARLLLLGTIIMLSANVARAVSVSEYHEKLKQAVTALDTLTTSDEEETESQFQDRFDRTLGSVKKLLPETIIVNCGEELCTVDNSWLHEDLKKLELASDDEWTLQLTHVIERLNSIEQRVGELLNPAGSAPSKATDKQRLSEILQRPEYQTTNKASGALARLFEAFTRWLAKLFARRLPAASGGRSTVGVLAQLLVVGLALAVLAYVARLILPRVWRPRQKKKKEKAQPRIVLGERLEPDQSAVDLLSEAEALAKSGQVRAAIRKAYIALLVELGDRQLLSLAQHKTNRDYLRSLRALPALYPIMTGLTHSFERHWYGLIQATPNDWQDFREAYRAALQTKS